MTKLKDNPKQKNPEFFQTRVWDGELMLPSPGEFVEISMAELSPKTIKGFVTGNFQSPTPKAKVKELTPQMGEGNVENNQYIVGIAAEMVELPETLETTKWGKTLLDILKTRGIKGLLEFAKLKDSTIIYAYGNELIPSQGIPPLWYEKYELSGQEELAALIVAVIGQTQNDKDWENQLCHTAWNLEKWENTPYPSLRNELEKIRNSANINYINWVVKKHKNFLKIVTSL